MTITAAGAETENCNQAVQAQYLLTITDPDGIKEIRNEKLKIKNEVYDLLGRKVQNPTKGLYIMDGKKMIR